MPRKNSGWVYVKRKKTKPNEPGHWDQKKRLEAVTTFLATGNASLTSAMVNVPFATICNWKKQDWWKDQVALIRSEGALELNARLAKVVDKSIDSINDRIENGDYVFDQKRGQVTRVPVKLRDLHRVATDLIDKRQILEDRENRPVTTEASLEDRLVKIAETFVRNIGKERLTPVGEIIEGEFTDLPEDVKDAVSEKWSPRLQEGTGLGEGQETKEGKGQSAA